MWFSYNKLQAGKRVVLFSYGSGLTATMFSLQLRAGEHPFSLANIASVMNVAEKLKSRHEVHIFSSSLFFFIPQSNISGVGERIFETAGFGLGMF